VIDIPSASGKEHTENNSLLEGHLQSPKMRDGQGAKNNVGQNVYRGAGV
jgi:hypothetical protein